MSEEIITIKTEEVKVSELQGRDKAIYDYAFQKGYDKAVDFNKQGIVTTIARASMVIMVVCFVAIIIRGCFTNGI